MKYDDVPVVIKNNELPNDKGKRYKEVYDERVRTSGGFIDALFLGGIIVVSFLWGMLAIILR